MSESSVSLWGDGWTNPHVRDLYRRYMESHNGELTIASLAEFMYCAGGREMLEATRDFGDILPMLRRVDERTHRLIGLYESMGAAA